MRATYGAEWAPEDPASAVRVGDVPEPAAVPGWATVEVASAALNMHDVWLLRGAGRRNADPVVIGSDAAGTSEGRDVVVYPVAPGPHPANVVPQAILISDVGHGTFAERVVVPADSLVDKPAHLSFDEAACLPTTWLTAWRMLFTQAGLEAKQVVLVQGAGGGVATAALALAKAAGASVVVTSRSPDRRERAVAQGADLALATGDRLPQLADVVIDPVGPATLEHSTSSVRPGGAVVVCGSATGEFTAPVNLLRLFAREFRLIGSTTGTLTEFRDLVGFVGEHRLRPVVDSAVPLDGVRGQVERMVSGAAYGKLVVRLQ